MKLTHKATLIATLSIVFTICSASARTVTILVSQLNKTNLTSSLRAKVQDLTYEDNAIIYFDQSGTFTIEGTIEMKCNVEIKGKSTGSTTILLNNGTNRNGFQAFTDDAFFKVKGTKLHPLSVSIHDISINLKPHTDTWWPKNEKFAVKIYHGNPVTIENVNSTLENARCTNIDLRVCSNVTVSNCTITNYNNSDTGGNLWLRGEMSNVNITGNTFNKFGNDECIAFFELTNNANIACTTDIIRSNVKVTNNTFNYGNYTEERNVTFNDVLLTYFSLETDNGKFGCASDGFEFANNKITLTAPVRTTLSITFKSADTHKNFKVHDNTIVNAGEESSKGYYHSDFEVFDQSRTRDTVFFNNNKITNNVAIVNEWGGCGYTCMKLRGGNVVMDGTKHTDNVSSSDNAKDAIGTNFIWCCSQGGWITLRNNVVKGLKYLATVSEGNGIDNFSITARNNYFQGDTRIYCNKVNNLDLYFVNNTFNSTKCDFFLQEFANQGTLVFDYNEVTAPSNGMLMTHWTGTSTSTMKFNRFEMIGNKFNGISNQNNLTKNITNVSRRTVRNNSFGY